MKRQLISVVMACVPFLSMVLSARGGLIAHYTFDNALDIGADVAGSNHGTLFGNTSQVPGRIGLGALALDGDGDYVNVGGNATFQAVASDGDGWTVATWAQTAGNGGVQRIFSTLMPGGWAGGGWGLGMRQDRGSDEFISTTYGVVDMHFSAAGVLDNNWHHLAYVFRNNAGTVATDYYVDGSLVGSATPANGFTISPTTADFGIGALQLPTATQFFNGVLDDLRVYDNPLSAFEISQLANPGVGLFNLEIDRTTGVMTLRNDSSTPRVISALDITSSSGSLDPGGWLSIADNYDADSGNHAVDPVNVWSIFSATADNLAEGTLGAATIQAGQTIDFGNAWLQSPFEDVAISLLLEDGTLFSPPVSFVGNDDEPFAIADLNFDGAIDTLDWPLYRNGYRADLSGLTTAQAYVQGDLNFDGVNNGLDYALFKQAFDAANGAGAFDRLIAGLPEPSAAGLLLLGGLGLAAWRRRAAGTTLLLAALLLVPAVTWAQVPSLVSHWPLDANGSDSVGGHNGQPLDVQFGLPGANAQTGSAALFNGSSSTITVPFTPDLNPTSFTVTLWANASSTTGFQSPITSRDDYLLGVATHGYIIYNDSGGNWNFWTGDGDPGWATLPAGPVAVSSWTHLAISFDAVSNRKAIYVNGGLAASSTSQGYAPNGIIEMEDLHIGSGSDTGTEFYFDGLIDDVAVYEGVLTPEEIQRVAAQGVDDFALLRLSLQVNTSSGLTTLRNSAGLTIDFDQYEILSPSQSLNPAGWNSLQDQDYDGSGPPNGTGDGWEELGTPSAGFVGEAFLQGSTPLSTPSAISLGTLFDTSMGVQDLEFTYRLASGAFVSGEVEYVTGGTGGDFNGDGSYDCADVDGLVAEIAAGTNGAGFDLTGDGLVDTADLTAWLAEAGAAELPSGNPFLEGDANLDGVVDVSDFNVWNGNKFTSVAAWCRGDFNADGVVDVSDFNLWNGRKFQSSANGLAAVPEPAGWALLGLGLLGLGGRGWSRRSGLSSLGLLVGLCLVSPAWAVVTNDRDYRLGEGTDENGVAGAIVGSGVTIPGAGDALDDTGPSGAFLDLTQLGNPVYVNVHSGGKARAGTSAGDLGVQFDGTSTVLDGFPLNRPDELDAVVGGNYPLNYDGITGRGLQLWAYPDQSGLNAGRFQSLVFDSILSGGPAITADGRWTQVNSQHLDGSDGIAPVPATVSVPSGDRWYHLMHHNYQNGTAGAPRVVAGTGAAAEFTSVLYVDGIAVSANNDAIPLGGITTGGRIGKLAVGAAELPTVTGTDPAYGLFFEGVVDNLEMYVYGDNSSQGGQDYGTFDLFADNAWIAEQIALTVPGGVLIPGDINRDGGVNGDGTGPAGADDVTAFVAGWKSRKQLQGAHNAVLAGDWETWGRGDLNHDGITDLLDWHVLRTNHPTPQLLDLNALLQRVPEPSSLALLILAAGCLGLRRRSRPECLGVTTR